VIHCALLFFLGVDQRRDGGVAAHLGQAAAAIRADAADRYAELGADLGVGQWRVRDEQGDQPLAVWRQVSERLAQCRVALRSEQLVFGRPRLLGREVLGVKRADGRVRSAGRAQDPLALPAGCGGEPSGQRGRLADLVQLVHQAQPDALADILRVGAVEPVPAADRPDERRVPLDERVPGPLVASSRPRHQVNDQQAIVRRGICLACEARAVILGHFTASVSRCLFWTAPSAFRRPPLMDGDLSVRPRESPLRPPPDGTLRQRVRLPAESRCGDARGAAS
jgi:hypothetical protein